MTVEIKLRLLNEDVQLAVFVFLVQVSDFPWRENGYNMKLKYPSVLSEAVWHHLHVLRNLRALMLLQSRNVFSISQHH